MKIRPRARLLGCAASLVLPATPVLAQPAATAPHGPTYVTAPPMDATIEDRLMPQLAALLHQLLREKRAMRLDGVPVFDSGDKFLPGKIASGLHYLLLDTPRGDPRLAQYLAGYRDIADLTIDDPNDTWGIYYYISALYALKKAGLLEEAVRPETLARLRTRLDWRNFVEPGSLRLLHDLPNNYYGVAFSVARLRYLLGWEDEAASRALLQRMIAHYRTYSGKYGFADETEGHGRFDRYSILLIGEIAQRFIETGMAPDPQVKGWLRKSADLMLDRASLTGEGWEYGRSIGTYGETAFLEVLTAAAKLDVLTPKERDMAYALSSRIAARYADFWLNPATGSVNLWDDGRRTDGYRGKHRILGENLSLARQYIYTNALWNGLGYKRAAPAPGYAAWLGTRPGRFTWFARGDHDRALLTLRDRGHVIGLPIISGAEDQHMHNPYFPIPFSGGMLQGSADAGFPQLTPRFALGDGSVLMPLAWFRGVTWKRQGKRTTVSWRQDAMDRMGANAPAADKRITVTTRYDFAPGRITRTDTYRAAAPVDLNEVTTEFASFSGDARSIGPGAVAFGAGEVTSFSTTGYDGCTVGPASGKEYRAPTGAFASLVRCRMGARRLAAPLILTWTLSYK